MRHGTHRGHGAGRSRTAPARVLETPSLAALHRHSEADWRRIFATEPEMAVAWIGFAARSGFKAAQLVLGQMHLDGHGVARDAALAYAWFTKAASLGSVEARTMVGRCHELGWGVPVDHAVALVHYRKAATAGSAWGAYNVGCLLLYGTGLRRDHAAAFAALQAAADRDHAKAMGLLGRCHEEGWGTPVDAASAARWYARAAEGGDAWGALNLGLIQAEAGAVREAAVWFERAVAMATPNCLVAIAQALEAHPDPEFARIAVMARTGLVPDPTRRLSVHLSSRGAVSMDAETGPIGADPIRSPTKRRTAAPRRRGLKLLFVLGFYRRIRRFR